MAAHKARHYPTLPGQSIFDREPAPRFTTVGRAVVVAGPNDIAVTIGGQRLRGLSAQDGLDIIAALTEALR